MEPARIADVTEQANAIASASFHNLLLEAFLFFPLAADDEGNLLNCNADGVAAAMERGGVRAWRIGETRTALPGIRVVVRPGQ